VLSESVAIDALDQLPDMTHRIRLIDPA